MLSFLLIVGCVVFGTIFACAFEAASRADYDIEAESIRRNKLARMEKEFDIIEDLKN